MRVKSIHVHNFRRFTDLTIQNISPSARLVILVGPNGSGKSSLLDGLRVWHGSRWKGSNFDQTYHAKVGTLQAPVEVNVWEPVAQGDEGRLFSFRSAYRNEADFSLDRLVRLPPVYEAQRVARMIDNDVAVSQNFQRLVSLTLSEVFDQANDDVKTRDLRDRVLGDVRLATEALFPDLGVVSLKDPLLVGAFTFDLRPGRSNE